MTSSIALSSSDSDVIQRTIEKEKYDFEDKVDIKEVFEIDGCVRWIKDQDLKNVTLQFPDSLLKFAPEVVMQLEKQIGKRVAVLGDTSFGECCVDEIAAEHVQSDGVIHFGNTCLTRTQRLPVLYIFTTLNINTQQLQSQIQLNFPNQKVFLFYDVRYHRSLISHFQMDSVIMCQPSSQHVEGSDESLICGRHVTEAIKDEDIILYCGNSQKFSLLLALALNKNKHFVFDPKINSIQSVFNNIQKELMKRYYMIEKIKDASRIGILVGTLGVTRYQDVIDRVHKSVKESGKRSYTFLLGNPNVPKLANFPEIDVFVMIACPENSIIGSKEFMQPVVTPFELDIALNKNREWNGEFLANFQDILPQGLKYVPFEKDTQSDISLISGKLRSTEIENNEVSENSLVPLENRTLVAVGSKQSNVNQGEAASKFLNNRSWTGLDPKLGETPVEKAVKGQSGIAFGYQGEGD